VEGAGGKLIVMEEEQERIGQEAVEAVEKVSGPEDLIYCLYTSGSTGQPKGVLVEHRNVVRLLVNERMPFEFGAQDVWSMFHAYNFDFSVWEMYGALLRGGKLVVVPREVIWRGRR
jgi:gramicidin S synthase 2